MTWAGGLLAFSNPPAREKKDTRGDVGDFSKKGTLAKREKRRKGIGEGWSPWGKGGEDVGEKKKRLQVQQD